MATSSTPLISYWHPDVTYDFTLRIGEVDYSSYLHRVEIRTATTIPYQHIFLDILMDPREVLLEDLFGHQPVKLIIRLKGKEPEMLEQIDFDLMYINTEGEFTPVETSYESDQMERSLVRFKTICSKPYQTMSTMVNQIFYNQTPDSIITSLFAGTGAELNYDTAGRSKLAIDQLLIPPTTLYRVVNYLNKTYGIFDGPLGFHCSFDNKVKIQNLAAKTRTAQKFSLYLLATNQDNTKIYESDDPASFYTKVGITSAYQGNSVFAAAAPTRRYIVKPRDTLYKTIDINLQSFAKSYGVIEKNNPSIYFNSVTIDPEKRISYHKDQTGYDTDQTFINSNLSSTVLDMSVATTQITGNLPTLNLMEVGEMVKIISHTDVDLKLSGSYILKASDVLFTKQTTWESSANIYLSRTNIAEQ